MRMFHSIVLVVISLIVAPRALAQVVGADLVALYGGPIPSRGLINDPSNVEIQVNLPDFNSSGPFVCRAINFFVVLNSLSGGTWAREAQILVTPPGGVPFFVQPYSAAGPTELPPSLERFAVGVPIPPFATAGTWTFRFVEIFDDVIAGPSNPGNDALWTTMRITISEEPIYAGGFNVEPSPLPRARFTNFPSGGTPVAPLSTFTWTNDRPGYYPAVYLNGRVSTAGVPLSNTERSLPVNLRVAIRPPGASATSTFGPFPSGTTSTLADQSSYGFFRRLTYTGSGVGTWTLSFFPAFDFPDVPIENFWHDFAMILAGVPDDLKTELGTIAVGSAQTFQHAYSPSPYRFYRFTLAEDHTVANILGLQVFIVPDEFGMVGGFLGLYNNAGDIIAEDQDVGFGRGLSFGRAMPNNTQYTQAIFDGRSGDLTAGTYYLAASNDVVFLNDFQVGSSSAAPSLATESIALLSTVVPPPATTPGGELNLGGFTPNATENVVTFAPSVALTHVWFKLTLNNDVTQLSQFFLDVDLANTLTEDHTFSIPQAAHLIIYSERGRGIASSVVSPFDLLPWGGLSFGAQEPSRPPVPLPPGLPIEEFVYPRSGGNGDLLAGTYYIAAVADQIPFFQDLFRAAGSVPSRISLNLRTNMQSIPAPSPCGAADIGTEGGAVGSDGLLDNNDFVVFIDLFFQSDPRSDLGVEGGAAGADGLFDNNDFIVFIDLYFSGSGSPGCNDQP